MVFIASFDSLSLSEDFEAVTSTSTPLAPDRSIPSSSGQATACSAAMRARSGPLAAAVLEVDVDAAVFIDDFRDAADRVLEHVVGMGEGFVLRHVLAEHVEQLLV